MSAAPVVASPLALARPDILALHPYEHALWDPALERMHANELPWRAHGDSSIAGLNRYPEPQPAALVDRLAQLYDVARDRVLVGRGSDEAIDLLVRAFCQAGRDAVLITPPTFGMYAVAARIQGADVQTVPLDARNGFVLDESAVAAACHGPVKIVFVCSPNNPTGNAVPEQSLMRLAGALDGRALLVVDEAYGEFSAVPSMSRHLPEYRNLVVLRTLSKAHGLAGARCGCLLADPQIVSLLRKLIPPYAIPQLTVESVMHFLEPAALALMQDRIALIRRERSRVAQALSGAATVEQVWPSDANFLLASFRDADRAFGRAVREGLLVRDVRKQPQLPRALRLTIGTIEQNNRLLEALTT